MKTIKDIVISALSFFNYHYNADDMLTPSF